MRDQRGSLVIESVIYMGFSLLILVQVVNLGAWVIIRDLSASAADQGVRAGARADVASAQACEDRIAQVLGNLARGAGASYHCTEDSGQVSARVVTPLRSWLPGVPDSATHAGAIARKEQAP